MVANDQSATGVKRRRTRNMIVGLVSICGCAVLFMSSFTPLASADDAGNAEPDSGPPCEVSGQEKLIASDADTGDLFGAGVATHGDVVIVGAVKDDCSGGGSNCGSAYVYRFDGTTWTQEQKLTASDSAADDRFGTHVSISADVVLVGAQNAACLAGRCGAAYVYRFDGSAWIEEQKLVASDAHDGAKFGFDVAVDGNVALIGAFEDDVSDGDTDGAAYVFRFNGSSWIEEQRLTPSDALSFCGEGFGARVSLDGAVAVVGATYDTCESSFRNGAGYVFRYDGSSWLEEQRLTASDAAPDENFGHDVSVSGNVAIFGAFKADTPGGANSGAAYVFRFDGSSWQEEQKLVAFDAAGNDWYGHSVGIKGDVAFVGSYQDDCASGGNCGAGYVYQFDGTAWGFEQKLGASDAQAGDQLGSTVALSEMFAVANAGLVDCAAGADCGAAYVFSVDCKSLVPAVSQWGMVALVLILLAGVTLAARLGLKKGRRHVFG